MTAIYNLCTSRALRQFCTCVILHRVSKKVCHYIFGNNLNKNCPIAIIFGILITQTIGNRKVVSFPHRTLFVQLSYLGKHRTRKFTYFAVRSMLFCEKKKLGKLFHTNVLLIIQLFKMSSLCTYARFQSLSSLVDSRVNDVLLQTIPDINEALLQLIDVVQTAFAQSLLRNSPYLLVGGVKV